MMDKTTTAKPANDIAVLDKLQIEKAKLTRRQLGRLFELLDKYAENLYRRKYFNLHSKAKEVCEYVVDDIRQYDDSSNSAANKRQILQS